jgi:hypothetical protein
MRADAAQDRWGKLWRPFALTILAVLAAAAAYEAAVALGWLDIGPEPGQAPPANDVVLRVAGFALLAGAGLCLVRAWAPLTQVDALALLLAPAAVAFVLARFYSYDPYYAPTLRRMSDDGLVPDSWVYLLLGLALLAAVLVRIRPRAGLGATALVLLLSAVTALAEGSGH